MISDTSIGMEPPILSARKLRYDYGNGKGIANLDLEVFSAEVLAVVGESGSGKTTLLKCLSTHLTPQSGSLSYRSGKGEPLDILQLSTAAKRELLRTDWGFVHQHPHLGLRMRVSAGANVGERLMANAWRHYGDIRSETGRWLDMVEVDPSRIDEAPSLFSGGMQQRLQIARNLVTRPRLVFMDEPTGGLDVSVQAKLLDLLRRLVFDLDLALVLVTHDLAVARMLADRMIVMREGEIIESGLTDQILDDPQHPYSQLLVASMLAA